jgi:DNA invertase Pin-like site-specific DNA recombinase
MSTNSWYFLSSSYDEQKNTQYNKNSYSIPAHPAVWKTRSQASSTAQYIHGQTLDSQLEELEKAGYGEIYREVASGARSDRPELQRLLKAMEPGSVVLVTRLDRLARSTIDLLTIVKQIADRGCLFKSLADPWADTTTPAGRLMLTVLGGLAEFERELIKVRTGEGRERAKRNGIRMGRKPKLSRIK